MLRSSGSRIGRLIYNMGKAVGLDIFDHQENYHYCPTTYGSSFWKKTDIRQIPEFSELALKVIEAKRTYLYYDRLYLLYQALLNARRLNPQPASIAEVGVYKGGGTYFLASVANRVFATEPRIHAFDTFEGHPDEIQLNLDGEHRTGHFSETSLEEVQAYLAGFPNVTLHKGRFQDCCGRVSSERFSFVHVDVDIYSATRASLVFFAETLLIGGIIIVDDYGFTTCKGAQQAVDEFIAEHTNFCKFHLDTGQCMLIRLS